MGLKNYASNKISKTKKDLKETTKTVVGYNQITNTGKMIWDSFDHLRKGARGELYEKTNLSFEEIVEKNNISDEKLEQAYRSHALSFYCELLLTIVVLGFTTFYLAIFNIIAALMSLSVLGISIALMLRDTISCYRIKVRDFVTVKQWFASGEILPVLPFSELKMKKKPKKDI